MINHKDVSYSFRTFVSSAPSCRPPQSCCCCLCCASIHCCFPASLDSRHLAASLANYDWPTWKAADLIRDSWGYCCCLEIPTAGSRTTTLTRQRSAKANGIPRGRWMRAALGHSDGHASGGADDGIGGLREPLASPDLEATHTYTSWLCHTGPVWLVKRVLVWWINYLF